MAASQRSSKVVTVHNELDFAVFISIKSELQYDTKHVQHNNEQFDNFSNDKHYSFNDNTLRKSSSSNRGFNVNASGGAGMVSDVVSSVMNTGAQLSQLNLGSHSKSNNDTQLDINGNYSDLIMKVDAGAGVKHSNHKDNKIRYSDRNVQKFSNAQASSVKNENSGSGLFGLNMQKNSASNEHKSDVKEEDNETIMSIKSNKSHFYEATSYYTHIEDGFAKLEAGDKQQINVQIDNENKVLYATVWYRLSDYKSPVYLCKNIGLAGSILLIYKNKNGSATYATIQDDINKYFNGNNDNDKFETLLKEWGLFQYAQVMRDEGWDDPNDWEHLTLNELTNDLKFKKGHIKKWERKFDEWKLKQQQSSPEASPQPEQKYDENTNQSDGMTSNVSNTNGKHLLSLRLYFYDNLTKKGLNYLGIIQSPISFCYHLEIDTMDTDAIAKFLSLWESVTQRSGNIRDNKCYLGFSERKDGVHFLRRICDICLNNGYQLIKADLIAQEFMFVTASGELELEL